MPVREVGVTKAAMPGLTMFALAVLAGAFIALDALFYTVTVTTGITVTAGIRSPALGGGHHVQFGAHPGGRGWSGALYRQ